MSKYNYETHSVIKVVCTKDGEFVTTVTNSNRLKEYKNSNYIILDII